MPLDYSIVIIHLKGRLKMTLNGLIKITYLLQEYPLTSVDSICCSRKSFLCET